MTSPEQAKTKKRPVIVSILVSLGGFILILIGLNAYQYLKVKTNAAANMIQQINSSQLSEIQSFVLNISSKLNMVRDWGKNGLLVHDNVINLNKKFIPIMDHQPAISGLLLATSAGWEYYLTQAPKGWISRVSSVGPRGTSVLYQQWTAADKLEKQWRKTVQYDPRKRPWFHRPGDERKVYWTKIYTFFGSQKQGLTASVSWEAQKPASGLVVFGIDILLDGVEHLLRRYEKKHPGLLFLTNARGNYFITAKADLDRSAQTRLLSAVMQQWKSKDQPIGEQVQVSFDHRRWLASLQPLVHDNAVLWVGIAAPQKELLAQLKKQLFQFDATDILVACGGGLLMLLVTWKSGAFRREPMPAPAPVVRLQKALNAGEGAAVEFKSTVRTNLKTGKTGKEIELAWLKAVVAFLNTDGGTLLIGVADDGKIAGLGADHFENSDRCLLHVKNLINQHVGAEFSSFIRISLVAIEENQVLLIECEAAGEPVFLKIGKNEEFFVRSGPASTKLSPSQMISYVLQNRA